MQKEKAQQKARVSTLNCYGVFLAKHGRLPESHAAFNEALQLDPTEVLAHINLGNLYDQEGKKTEAEQAYRKALSLDPDDAWAHYNLGLLLSEKGKRLEAENEFKKAHELEPADLEILKQYDLLRETLQTPTGDKK
jgi:Flp pilus assembly protein TadD